MREYDRTDLVSQLPWRAALRQQGESIDRLHFWRTPTASCTSQGNCVPYSRWSTDYIAVMGGH